MDIRPLLRIVAVLSITMSLVYSAAAQAPTKTARACAHEFTVRKPDLVGMQRHRRDFVARCRVTPVGVLTPTDDEAIGSALDVSHPEIDYKEGFMFTPAYLSSPQVLDRLRRQH